MEENKVIEGAAVENAALEAEAKPAKPAKAANPAKDAKPAEEAPKRVANEDFNWYAFENDLDLYGGNKEAAKKIGQIVAERCKAKGIETVVFDRGGYVYHGRVQALAEGAREGGLQF